MLVIAISFLTVSISQATEPCRDSDGGKNVDRAGGVIYAVHPEVCTGDGGNCVNTLIKERDRCASSREVIELWCENGKLKEETVPCPPEKQCRKGKCEFVSN